MPKKSKVEEEPPRMPRPGDPDYRAVRVSIYGGHCAFRNPKEKEKADPYLLVSYEHQVFESKQLTRTTHPRWNETYEFPIPPAYSEALGELAIQMWDRNGKKKMKGQIFLGEVRIPLCEIADVNFDYCEPRKYPLARRGKEETKKDRVKGDLMIKIGMVLPKPKNRSANKNDGTEQLIHKAEGVVDDSLASATRSLKMALNTRDVGAETLDKLNAQGEQLRRIQADIDDIDAMQDLGARYMRTIESVPGAIANKFTSHQNKTKDHVAIADKESAKARRKKHKEQEEEEDEILKIESKAERKRRHKRDVRNGDKDVDVDANQTDFSLLSMDAQQKIKQTDDILDQIGSIMDDLKVQALEMGDEIDDHNSRLAILKETTDVTNLKMKDMNRKIDRRLGK